MRAWLQQLNYFIVVCILVSLTGCAALLTPNVKTELQELRAGEYKLDKSHTSVIFKITHLGLSTYVGRFNDYDASLDFDPDNIAATNLEAKVLPSSVDTNNEKLEKTLQESDWFNTAEYPEINFTTESVELQTDNTFLFTGLVTLRGVTKPVTLNAKFNGGAVNILTAKYTLGFEATTTIKRSDFGMDEYIPLVGDDVQIEIYAEFQKR